MSETNTPDYKDSAEVALMLEREIDRRVAIALLRILGVPPHLRQNFEDYDDSMLQFVLIDSMSRHLSDTQHFLDSITRRLQIETRRNFETMMPDIRVTFKGNTAPW